MSSSWIFSVDQRMLEHQEQQQQLQQRNNFQDANISASVTLSSSTLIIALCTIS